MLGFANFREEQDTFNCKARNLLGVNLVHVDAADEDRVGRLLGAQIFERQQDDRSRAAAWFGGPECFFCRGGRVPARRFATEVAERHRTNPSETATPITASAVPLPRLRQPVVVGEPRPWPTAPLDTRTYAHKLPDKYLPHPFAEFLAYPSSPQAHLLHCAKLLQHMGVRVECRINYNGQQKHFRLRHRMCPLRRQLPCDPKAPLPPRLLRRQNHRHAQVRTM